MKIKNVIFDVDGTLLDTSEGVIESVLYTIKEMKMKPPGPEKLPKFVGPPIQESLMNYCGCSKAEAQNGANLFRNYYKEKALFKATPYDGIFELFEDLRNAGYAISIATYKRADYALQILKYFGFDKYCTSIHGADNENIMKKSDIIKLCMKETGGMQLDSVYIGDTVHDANGALKNDIYFIAVSYGFGYKPGNRIEMEKYLGMAHKAKDVMNILM